VAEPGPVERYLELGLRLGRLLDGLVDSYYGPPELARRVGAEPSPSAGALADDARRLLADLDAGTDETDGEPLGPQRRAWLRVQVVGLHTTARRLGGAAIGYVEEVESCYGVTPRRVPEDDLAQAHRALDDVLGGTGPLRDRIIVWREAQAVPPDLLRDAIASLVDDFRERTHRLFGLPEGERVDFELVTDEPWAGFNYYLGGLRSRVAINIDLPVLSTSLGALVAHEAYPGHHTEHSRKEVDLVRVRGRLEETIALVGTPQNLLAEGLADLGLEVVAGVRPEPVVAAHLRPLGIPYDAEVAARVAEAGEALGAVRGNLALQLNADGADGDDVVAYAERWALLPHNRAVKTVQFLTDPTWRAYIFCYVEGLPLCRRFVGGDAARFERLLSEQLVPADLAGSAHQ